MTNTIPLFLCALALLLPVALADAQPADTPATPPAAIAIEAEDFRPQGANGWRVVRNGEGNYMVDTIGFNHISGEHLLSAPAKARDARASATVEIPDAGTYRVWSRFEQPTGRDNRFRVEIRQNGKLVGQAVMGEKDAPKWFPGVKEPVGQADFPWGSEGLVVQSFDVAALQKGAAQITLVAIDQPRPGADRNVDLLYLTQDLENNWRKPPSNPYYPILDATLAVFPARYYLRLTSPDAQTIGMRAILNRIPWFAGAQSVTLQANVPSDWIPLKAQDVAHFTTWSMVGKAGQPLRLRAEFASAPDEKTLLRAINWNDPDSSELQVGLPPYPNKYPGEKIITVAEQYQDITNYLKAHPSTVGREPMQPLAWGGIPIWEHGRVADAAADLYFAVGMRDFLGIQPATRDLNPAMQVARERFAKRGLQPNRGLALGSYRSPPTPENIAIVRATAEKAGALPNLQRFDYGDEIAFSEWIKLIPADQLQQQFADWQIKKHGAARYAKPDSSAQAAQTDPILYVDSQDFYEEAAIQHVAQMARAVPKELGPDVLYGANVAAHPFYYPEIAKYIKWFRATPTGDYAANFGRHSEYFWQVGQPGPLVNGYIADHFTAGMRENPQAVLQQYNMPHSPGNADNSFRRSAFTHLAHGARALDYFGMGINSSFTENYIDFRDPQRYAAIRDINRAMATVEDILPTSRPAPTKVAMILSDSTERWDLAPVALDGANFSMFGDDSKKVRLAYHQERVGLYYALVHSSRPPDMLTEEDVQRGDLKNYAVAYWVGDCAMAPTVASLRTWVEGGGHLVATAGALRFDQYRQPLPAGQQLLGLQTASLQEHDRFFRPQIELPRLQPLDQLGSMPALAFLDSVTPAPGAQIRAAFKSGKPAVIDNPIGRGRTTFIATLPGVAYLWSAYQPAPGEDYLVPSRGPLSHRELEFNRQTAAFIAAPARETSSYVEAGGARIDARLLSSPAGDAIALANYNTDVKAPVTLTIRVPGAKGVSSAVAGRLKVKPQKDGSFSVRYVTGYGDILRIER